MKPNPDFLQWFATTWKDRHGAVTVPGLPYASWDRKAAYLLWIAEGHAPSAVATPAPPTTTTQDLFE